MSKKKLKLPKFDSVDSAAKLQAEWQNKVAQIMHYEALSITDSIMEYGQKKAAQSVTANSDNKTS